jgi:ketosteroid isomerase-like protein
MATTDETKAVVNAYYQAGVRGDLPRLAAYLASDFSVTAPCTAPLA